MKKNETEFIIDCRNKVLAGGSIDKNDALELLNVSAGAHEMLLLAANAIRENFNGNSVEVCSIVNGRSGRCTENCAFCAQASIHHSGVDEYESMDYQFILEHAQNAEKNGATRFSIVTSGRGIENGKWFDNLLDCYSRLKKETDLRLCASHGLITRQQAVELAAAGVTRYHHNLETGRNYFSNICTTHSYEQRIETIRNAQFAGMAVCSGGIIGMGESLQDRIDMAFELKALNVESVPVNILIPIAGTRLEGRALLSRSEVLRTYAVFRMILPDRQIRYAAGRATMEKDRVTGYQAGVNATIAGTLLTTAGQDYAEEKSIIMQAGRVVLSE